MAGNGIKMLFLWCQF